MTPESDEIFEFNVELVEAEEVTPESHRRRKIDASPPPLPSEWGPGESSRETAGGKSKPLSPLPPKASREALPSASAEDEAAARAELAASQPPRQIQSGGEHQLPAEISPISSLVQTVEPPPQPKPKKRAGLFGRRHDQAEKSSDAAEETETAKPGWLKTAWAKLNSDISRGGKKEASATPVATQSVDVEAPSEPPVVAPVVAPPAPPEVAPKTEPAASTPPVVEQDSSAEDRPERASGESDSWLKRLWRRLNTDIGSSKKDETRADSADATAPELSVEAPPAPPAPPSVEAPPAPPAPPASAPVFERDEPREESQDAPPEVSDPDHPQQEPAASEESVSLWQKLKNLLNKDLSGKKAEEPEEQPAPDLSPAPVDLSASPEGALAPAQTPEERMVVREESQVIKVGEVDENELSERERKRAARQLKREEEKRRAEERREKKDSLKQKLKHLNESTERASEKRKAEREVKKREKKREEERKAREKAERDAAKAEEKAKKEEEKEPGLRERVGERRRRKAAARARRIGKDIVGLKIGASSVRAVHLRENEPIKVYEYPLLPGVIVDGLLEDPDELTQALRELWKASELTSKKVNFSLNNRLITVRTIPQIQIDDEQLDQALAVMASIVIHPMDPEQSIIDYDKLSRTGEGQDIQMAAADRKMVESYVKAIEKAGLSAVSCEIGALAASRAMIVPRVPGQAHFVVDIGAELTTVTAVSGPDLFFYRVIEIGGNDFTRAIADALGVSFIQAEKYKMGASLNDSDPRVSAALTRIADQLAQEIQQTKGYFQDDIKRGGRPVVSWSLIGGGARLEGLCPHLQLYTHIGDLEDIEPWPGLEGAPDLELTTDALGLAKSHTMSLIPDVSPTSFSVTAPFRRKAKISLSEADKRAKRLSKSRAPKKELNYKLYGGLVALAILVGSFFLADRLTPTETTPSAPTEEAAAPSGSTVLSYDDPSATKVAKILQGSLSLDDLDVIPTAFEKNRASIQTASVSADTLQVTGVAPSEQLVRQLTKDLTERIPGADVELKMGALNTNGQGFSLVITAPNTPEGS